MAHEDQTLDSSDSTIVFGILGILITLVGLAIAGLQLRHMQKHKRRVEVYELP